MSLRKNYHVIANEQDLTRSEPRNMWVQCVLGLRGQDFLWTRSAKYEQPAGKIFECVHNNPSHERSVNDRRCKSG